MPTLRRYGLVYPILVVIKGFWTNVQLKIWEFGEDGIMQIGPLQCETFRVVQSFVYELTFLLIDHIVIADKLLISLCLTHFIRFWSYSTWDQSVTDSYEPFLNEIHLIHFLIFIVDYLIVNVVLKAPGQEALSDLEKKANVLLLVQGTLGVVKESPEGSDHIFE